MEALQKATRCPKCLDAFSQPKLLPCLHCVCSTCLTVRDGVRESEGLRYMVSCPVCGDEAELPKDGLSTLPDAFYKMRMSESLSKATRCRTSEEKQGCQECGRGEAASHCKQCDHFICADCLEAHRQTQPLSEHELESLDGQEQAGLDELDGENGISELDHAVARLSVPVDSLQMTCSKHDQPLSMYCSSCSVLICEQCSRETHTEPRHKFSFIHTRVRSLKAELKQSASKIRDQCATLAEAAAQTNEVAAILTDQEEQVTSTIEASFAELIQELEECKAQLLSCARTEASAQLKLLQEQAQGYHQRTAKLDSLATACAEIIQYSTNQEFMALRRLVIAQVKEVERHKINSTSSVAEARNPLPLTLSLSYKAHVANCVKAHREVHHLTSMTKSTIERLHSDKPVKIGDEVRFVVHTKYRSGKPCIEMEKDEVFVAAKVPRSDTTMVAAITPTTTLGCYEAAFTPQKRGQYEVSFKVSGEELTFSPFFITAMPKKLNWDRPAKVISDQEWPWSIACQGTSNREVYVTRNVQHQIAVLDANGRQVRTLCRKGQKPGNLWHPTGIALDMDNFIYVADGQENGRLQKLTPNGQLVCVTSSGQLSQLGGVMVDRNDDRVYVCDRLNQRVDIFDKELKLLNTFGELSRSTGEYHELTGTLISPHSLAQDSEGRIYVTDPDANCIQVFDREGEHLTTITHLHRGGFGPSGICIEGDVIYVTDCVENSLVVLRTGGEFVAQFGSYGQLEGQFYTPSGVAMDIDGFLYVCDLCNNRLQIF